MTDIQKLFADEFLIDLNGAAAARRAGYDPSIARQMSYKNINIPEIREYVQSRMAERSKATFVDSTFVVEGLKEVHARCMQATPVMVYDSEAGDYVQKQDDAGNNIWTFDAAGANKALDLLGKHTGTFEKDNAQKQPVVNLSAAVSAMSTLDRMILKYGSDSEEVKKYTEKYGNASTDRPNK